MTQDVNQMLYTAILLNQIKHVEILINYGDSNYQGLIGIPILRGNLNMVKILLSNCHTDPTLSPRLFHNNYGIREASKRGYTEIVKLLLSCKGPNVEQVDPTQTNNKAVIDIRVYIFYI